jgi:hypothetical protein
MNEEKKEYSDPSEKPTKYEEDVGNYLHLKIEEQKSEELDIEKAIVPESVRHSGFWQGFHTRRRILASRTANFFLDTKKMIFVWGVLVLMVTLGILFEWNRNLVGGVVLLFGIVSSAFSWLAAGLLGAVGMIPFVGPFLVSILSSSLLWVINALGYFVSVVAIKAGHGKAVLNYRLMVIVFLTGLVTGYVIARLIQ